MKILVVTNMVPFVWGGAEELAKYLCRQLNDTPGIQSEILRVPFRWDPPERLIDEMYVARSLRIENADRVIAMKFPAYLIPHSRKTIWLVHQLRQAYDLYDSGISNIPDSPRGQEIRDAVRTADNACFRAAQEILTIGRVPSERLLHYNGVTAEALPSPLNDPEIFRDEGHGDYIFAGGRIDVCKRQHLLVEAMRYTHRDVRLVVGGPPANPEDAERLRALLRSHGLENRVTLDLGFLPRAKLANYVNHALACAYLPMDEDSVGYVTMEAFHAGKAVITVSDSGGVLDFVLDGETGYVTKPVPEAIASVMDRIFSDRAKSIRLGAAGRELLHRQKVTWPQTVERLIA